MQQELKAEEFSSVAHCGPLQDLMYVPPASLLLF